MTRTVTAQVVTADMLGPALTAAWRCGTDPAAFPTLREEQMATVGAYIRECLWGCAASVRRARIMAVW